MADLSKIKIDVNDGVCSIVDLTPEQAQEIWDRCAEKEGTKRFSREELYNYLQYIAWWHHFSDDVIKSCTSHEEYQKFLKDAEKHCGDCTQIPCSCMRCRLQMLEIEAQNALDTMWSGPKGHCNKSCLTECEGVSENG
jgi:hypothetical protein